MLFTVLAACALGIAVGGMIVLSFKLLRRPAPRGAAALAAGVAMFGFTIWNDYSWYERTRAALPQGLDAAASFEASSVFAPWTLIAPVVDRFAAVDRRTLLHHPDAADIRVAEIHLITRHRPTLTVREVFNCAKPARAEAANVAALDAIMNNTAAWTRLPADDPLLLAVCADNRPAS